MKTSNIDREINMLNGITIADLEEAKDQQDRGEPISNYRVKVLLRQLYATSGRVKGTDQAQYQL